MKESLFRKEVLAERQTQWLGTVLLTPTLSHRIFAIFAMLSAAGILSLLFLAHYDRKARIAGWLIPDKGLVQVYSPMVGVVTDIFVREGEKIQKGDRLLALSGELDSRTGGATQSEVVLQLKARRASLIAQRKELERLEHQQRQSLRKRLATLSTEKEQIASAIAIQQDKLQLAGLSEQRQRALRAMGAVSDQQLQAMTEQRLEEAAKLQTLERTRIANEKDSLTMQGELDDLPLKSETEVAKIERDVAAVEQDLAETEARRAIVIRAPMSGTISAIQAELGGRPNTNVPLMAIVPTGSKLEAQLYSPSTAVGFLKSGQRVLMRYQAYPYQKFGHYDGLLEAVSLSAINPRELPPMLAGLTGLVGSGEPLYRITVRLDSQNVRAYGKTVPLQPGMKLEADVIIERRRLYEWMLDPLYTLTGRVH